MAADDKVSVADRLAPIGGSGTVKTERDRLFADAKQEINQFLQIIWSEEGLADNTLSAYRTDLSKLAEWASARGKSLLSLQREDILAFLAFRVEQGVHPRSSARQLSSIRRFFRFMVREQRAESDPTQSVQMPKLGRPLPKSMTEADVERLLSAPDTTDPLGMRDRCMLEVLYASGLRVSELVEL